MEIVIAIISSGALSALISEIFSLRRSRKDKKDGISDGVQQLLYDKIKCRCKEYIEYKKIATNDLDDLEKMHKIYHDELGGNGFLDDLMNAVRKLPIDPVMPERRK